MSTTAEKHEFKAEVAAVLRLVTSSLYTNNEIFLRELVSNASDALDKARFDALVNEDLAGKDEAAEILITADSKTGRLVIEDSGIGMTREEASRNLGTIAHSGTLAYLKELESAGQKPDSSLIGQFGVGFYSAFMVADQVQVETLSAKPGNESILWRSTGDGSFEISSGSRTRRGTRIELTLKDDAKEFLEAFRIRNIVRRYSNYVMHPIRLVTIPEEGDPTEAEQINAASAIWAKSPKDLNDEEYQEFYTQTMGGFVMPGDEPFTRLHFSTDAPIQFNTLLFVPRHAPADLFQEDRKALQLYAKRVLVMDSCDRLLPQYLRFFRGVVDSEDLPLNVSREMLQEHKSLSAIRRQLTRKALKLLADHATENAEEYAKLWAEFGSVLKEGLHSDSGHRKELLEIARWQSIGKPDGVISLAEYASAMADDQEVIYYIAGTNEAALRASPHIESIRSQGRDVLVMTDAVDEWVLQTLGEYEGKQFRSVTQGDLDGEKDGTEDDSNAEDDAAKKADSEIGPLLAIAKGVLGDKVSDVRASTRLTETAACLVDPAGGLSRNMERILRMAQRDVSQSARILELNPGHGFVKRANELATNSPGDEHLPNWIALLHDLAALAEGEVPDPAGAVKRIQSVLDELAAAK